MKLTRPVAFLCCVLLAACGTAGKHGDKSILPPATEKKASYRGEQSRQEERAAKRTAKQTARKLKQGKKKRATVVEEIREPGSGANLPAYPQPQ